MNEMNHSEGNVQAETLNGDGSSPKEKYDLDLILDLDDTFGAFRELTGEITIDIRIHHAGKHHDPVIDIRIDLERIQVSVELVQCLDSARDPRILALAVEGITLGVISDGLKASH